MLVHDACLDVADLGPARKPVEHEVPQRVGVGNGDVQQEVVGARHVEDLYGNSDHLLACGLLGL